MLRLALAGVAVAAAVAATGAAASRGHEPCSARGLVLALPKQSLPPAVASMRQRIFRAALRCDYEALVKLGNERGKGLQFSYGGDRSAARYWSRLEHSRTERVMRALAIVLTLPVARHEGFYVWPSAHQLKPKPQDWAALRKLYPQKVIDAMRRGDIGYYGYRVGISPKGDWLYFVAGD